MLIRLRRQLALAYALLAGVVLLVVALSCLRVSEAQLRIAAQTAFDSGVDALVYKLQSDRTLSLTYLAQSEASARQIIYIEDGGVPLKFRGAWTPRTQRSALIGMALTHAETEALSLPLGSLSPVRAGFTLAGQAGEGYFASVVLVPSTTALPIRLAIIKDMAALDAQINAQRTTVLLLGVGGLLALGVIGWIYSGRAVRPAQENQKRQVEFTAVASHELKAPLTVISASVEALSENPSPVFTQNIAGECRRMAHLIDDMLLLARSDAGGWVLGRAQVDLDTLLIECYEMFYPVAARAGARLSLCLPDAALGSVVGDADRLKQALSVLLDNALFYAGTGGHVVLRGLHAGKNARLSVEDDGPGIPQELKERVFERFFRSDRAHSDRAHYGLGLSVARELIRLHGGKLWVEDAVPHGAAFVATLPLGRKGGDAGR